MDVTKSRFSLFAFVVTMAFFYAPLLVLVFFSFNASRTMAFSHFSFHWYEELLYRSPELWRALTNSVIIALSSATTATVLGTLGAIGIYRFKFRFKGYIRIASFMPLVLPEIIIGVSLLILFAAAGLPLSLFTIFIAHVTFNLPFVVLIVSARLDEFDYSVIEAAYDLGARESDLLLKVIAPISLPAIMAAFLIAITLSLEDFVITFFVAGPGSSTLPLQIYSMIRFGISPVINALSTVLIAGSIALAFLSKGVYRYVFQR